ncbi:hypothetical protein [Nitrosomonas sp.]|uniref:hypothetical protein n=1 Tax=Nitrosomonas sp. TaxID=42353 RepID=UPI0025FB85C0|nr:hypothetical protein [Nitrosomonas sp.]
MFLDDKKNFQTVWQLAHSWVGIDPIETDANAIPQEVRSAIHLLMFAIRKNEISVRTRQRLIFVDDSVISLAAEALHYKKIDSCLKQDQFNQKYLDSLYVKRNEILDWCAKIYCEPPSCWVPKHLSDGRVTRNAARNNLSTEDKVDTSQQREAAYDRHKPVENLKKDCIHYWLQHQSYSNNQAAIKFYEELPIDKKRLLSESNANRTLAQAISDYKNRERLKEKGKLPHWLLNFNPENPHT